MPTFVENPKQPFRTERILIDVRGLIGRNLSNASFDTLEKRMGYRGGRKQRSARKLLRQLFGVFNDSLASALYV